MEPKETPIPPEVPPSEAFTAAERLDSGPVRTLEHPGDLVGRYRLTRVLGEGGMGRVFEAYDPDLGRVVALKVVRRASSHAVARILQEARAQAKVDHPCICKIFEVGHDADRPFIVMQRVRGQDLEEARESLSLEQKVLLMKQVAEALHEAHRAGLIHRDLKPANIMVERGENGGLQPFIMDFGLARHLESQGLTLAGQLVGTPAYMPPEQARGDADLVDRRSDVYGLGATLYKLLTGRAPFEADTVPAMLDKVAHQEARSLQSLVPSVPLDLDTVVLKCLEKSPSARYPSARALAEDLGRFLDGEPVEARRVGWLGLLRKKIRKHRKMAAVIGVSGAVVAGTGAWGLRTHLRARIQAESAQRFGQEAERLEGFLRQARLLPAHDLRPERALVQGRLEALEKEIVDAGSAAEGPGRYVLGRVRLALGDAGQARMQLEKARSAGFRTPATAQALGTVLAELYHRAHDEAKRIPSKDQRTARLAEISRSLRDPAIALLKEGDRDAREAPGLATSRLAFVDGRLDEALRGVRQLLAQQPWLFEARSLAVEVLLARSNEAALRPDLARAYADLDEAGRWVGEARHIARSDERLAVQAARIHQTRWYLDRQKGGSGQEAMDAILVATDEALALDPEAPQAWQAKGTSLRTASVFMDLADPARLGRAQEAVKCLKMALDSAGERGEGADSLGSIWTQLGHAEGAVAASEMALGRDPDLAFRRAEACFGKARTLLPDLELVDHGEGDLHSDHGLYELRSGKDPSPSYRKSVEAYGRALARRPASTSALNNLGYTYKDWARYIQSRGEDASPLFAQAAEAFRKALAINPDYAFGWSNLAVVSSYQAGGRLARGLDPTSFSDEGLKQAARAIAINPKDGRFYMVQMEHWIWKARWAHVRRQDASRELKEAAASIGKGLELRPKEVYAHLCAARLAMLKARWEREGGREPGVLLKTAEAALAKALALNPKEAELLEARAMVMLLGNPGPAELQRARTDAEAALTANSRSTTAMLLLAEIERRSAPRAAHKPGGRSMDLVERALKEHPGLAEALALRGALKLAAGDRAGAAVDLKASLQANPLEDTDCFALPPRLASTLLRSL